jgi:hypothetical protein
MSSMLKVAPVDPQQQHDNNETLLWMSVMDRAVRDLVALENFKKQDPQVLDDPVFRYDYRTVKKWFYSSSMEPGAFNWICSLVNIDPSWAIDSLETRLHIELKIKSNITKSMQPKHTESIAA